MKGLSIPAKGFLVLIADKDTLKGADHIDLKLSADGESVFLYKQVNGLAVELAAFTFPLMAIVQEMCARIGMVTGRGLAGNIRQHFPRKVLYAASLLLFSANAFKASGNASHSSAKTRF